MTGRGFFAIPILCNESLHWRHTRGVSPGDAHLGRLAAGFRPDRSETECSNPPPVLPIVYWFLLFAYRDGSNTARLGSGCGAGGIARLGAEYDEKKCTKVFGCAAIV